jgi:hypothetical protein
VPSQSVAARERRSIIRGRKRDFKCLHCGKDFTARAEVKYCSNSCRTFATQRAKLDRKLSRLSEPTVCSTPPDISVIVLSKKSGRRGPYRQPVVAW